MQQYSFWRVFFLVLKWILVLNLLGILIAFAIAVFSTANFKGSGDATSPTKPSSEEKRNVGFIDDIFRGGRYELEITSFSVSRSVGSYPLYETANEGGILVSVTYRVTNTSDAPLTISEQPSLLLADENDVIYKPDSGKSAVLAANSKFDEKAFSDLNPGISQRGGTVFEVAESRFDPDTWTLRIKGSDLRIRLKKKPQAPDTANIPECKLGGPTTADALSAARGSLKEVEVNWVVAENSPEKQMKDPQPVLVHKLLCADGQDGILFTERTFKDAGSLLQGGLLVTRFESTSGRIKSAYQYDGIDFGMPPTWRLISEKPTLEIEIKSGYAQQGECREETSLYDLKDNRLIDQKVSTSCE